MRRAVTLTTICALSAVAILARPSAQTAPSPTAELDAFMQQVLARRDDNWKKIQQYILDEHERVELRGPGEALLQGSRREYMWYPRDGYFVRSPVKFNGVAIGPSERERYEQRFLARAKAREQKQDSNTSPPPSSAADMQSLIEQTREPQFVSSAYFLRFKFEAGTYALVGRETIGNTSVLRIEYYPTKLFSDNPSTRAEARANQATRRNQKQEAYGQEIQRLMNKASLVTIWVEPGQKQIVKYTFDNIGLEFLPAAWLVRVTDLRANMAMTEAFPNVWLPRRIDLAAGFLLAPGPFSLTYDIEYSGYREAVAAGKYLGPARGTQ